MAVNINQDLLARAVAAKIKPLLIDQDYLDDSKHEGYHHEKVIPKAQPLLARRSLEQDGRKAVTGAVNASVNLLSRFETMQAAEFLQGRVPSDVRDHVIELLYGKGVLADRIAAFLKWGGVREVKAGKEAKKVGFNATAASYLLAMSAPARYAFCKPKVYEAATRVLLGPEHVESDQVRRVVHCTDFYKAALELFQSRFGLDRFTDLMHCHAAFYIMDYYEDVPPTWDTLAAWTPNGDKEPKPTGKEKKPMSKGAHPLNLILYGPPGTGKTYHTMSRAVTICDGELPDGGRPALSARFNELRDEGRVEFVTFHQSYGYEEFVEGIRPVLVDGDSAGGASAVGDRNTRLNDLRYECPPGVFKRICDAATASTVRPARPFEVDLTKHRVWKMSLGDTNDPDDAAVYDQCIRQKQIRLGWGMGQDFTGCDDRAAVLKKLQQAKKDIATNDYNVQSVHAFKNEMKSGDLVIVSDGNLKFRAIGKVAGGYTHEQTDTYDQVRPVEWLLVVTESLAAETILRKRFSQMTLYQLREHVLKVDSLGQMLSAKSPAASPLPYVLVIDEINRGNISKVFGELITLVEPDKRLGADNELRATLPYSGERFGVPANLHLIGTMNTADRSIAFLDTALRRRFRFEEMMPDPQVIRDNVDKKGVVDGVDVAALLEAINRRVELLYDRDHQIGHSYFLAVRTLADLHEVLQYQVIPLLQEYFHDDWTKVCNVLGCPYDGETGKALSKNPLPLIVAESLDGALTPGAEPADLEPRFRYSLNGVLGRSSATELRTCFAAVLNGSAAATDGDGEE